MGRDSGGIAIPPEYKKNFNSHARVGRDMSKKVKVDDFANFNSHARVGRDADICRTAVRCIRISTHTPAWGATLSFYGIDAKVIHFNSHARVGRDMQFYCINRTHKKFQLTRPRGARQC